MKKIIKEILITVVSLLIFNLLAGFIKQDYGFIYLFWGPALITAFLLTFLFKKQALNWLDILIIFIISIPVVYFGQLLALCRYSFTSGDLSKMLTFNFFRVYYYLLVSQVVTFLFLLVFLKIAGIKKNNIPR